MYQPEYKSDIRSVVRYTMNEVLENYRNYHGCQVKEILDDGIVLCYIPTLSTEDNKDTWIPCKNGTRYYSNIIPDVDDYLVVQMQTGSSLAFYVSFDPDYYQVLNNDYDKVIFEYKQGLIYFDSSELIVENGLSKMTVKTSGIELKTSPIVSPQKMLLGEDTVSLLEELIDAINDITVMTPVGVSGKVSDMPGNANLKVIKLKLQTLLSTFNKNN